MNSHTTKIGTLFIVPGWMHTHKEWSRAADALPNWHVACIDLPGFGAVPLVSDTWGVEDYARYVEEKIATHIKQRSPTHVVLLGHSFGGRVLVEMLGKATPSEHVRALILFAAPCLYRPRLMIRIRHFAARCVRLFGLRSMVPNAWRPYDLRHATDAGLGAIFKRSVPHSQEDSLSKIHIPTHILWGSGDHSVPLRIAEEMKQRISGSTLTILSGEGHNIHTDSPILFFGALTTILNTITHA
jgi:pimeloyl-ACP methyl ester carboxylesterase